MGISDITQKGRTLQFTLAKFSFEAVAAVCALPVYARRMFLAPKSDKPLLTLKLAAGENGLKAAEEFLKNFANV